MFTFCDVLHDAKQKKQKNEKQTLESTQCGLEISFHPDGINKRFSFNLFIQLFFTLPGTNQ